MRILFFNHTGDLYGAARSLLRLSRRLVADGHEVKVIIPAECADHGPLAAALRAGGVQVQAMAAFPLLCGRIVRGPLVFLRWLWQCVAGVFAVRRECKRWRPDLVHCNGSPIMAPALACRLGGIPHVWHLREGYQDHPLVWRCYEPYMHWGATRVVAVSEAVASQFPARHRAKVRVIHNGFPRDEFALPDPAAVAAFREQYGLNGHPVIGQVGRISHRKGAEVVVRAVARLRDRYPRLRCLLVGSVFPGNEAQLAAVEQAIAELNLGEMVTITGDLDEVKAAYCAMDVSVMAAVLPDSFSGVIIESMALERPLVATALGGTLEQVEDGRNGLLVPPDDPVALAEALDKMLADEEFRREMAREGRRRFLEEFDFEPFYARLTGLYEEVLAEQPRS